MPAFWLDPAPHVWNFKTVLPPSVNATSAAQKINSIIGQAQAEGRDLTDAEMQTVISARKMAQAAADAALA